MAFVRKVVAKLAGAGVSKPRTDPSLSARRRGHRFWCRACGVYNLVKLRLHQQPEVPIVGCGARTARLARLFYSANLDCGHVYAFDSGPTIALNDASEGSACPPKLPSVFSDDIPLELLGRPPPFCCAGAPALPLVPEKPAVAEPADADELASAIGAKARILSESEQSRYEQEQRMLEQAFAGAAKIEEID